MQLYTIEDVAKILKVHDRTVRRYMKSGELQGINLGTDDKPNWRFSEEDIKVYLEKRRTGKRSEKDGE
jgi:excisionase family DNA binding protein